MLGTRGFSQGTHRTLGALHLSKRVRLLDAHTATETSCAVIARPPRPAAAARAGEAWEKVAKAHRRLVKIRPVNSSAAPGSDCCSHGKREKVTARKMMDNQTIINYVSPAGSNMIC